MTSSLSGERLNVNARRGVIINDTEKLWRDGSSGGDGHCGLTVIVVPSSL